MKKRAMLFQLFLPLFIGGVVGLIIAPFMDYQNLVLPPFSPPGFVFPVAWSFLYLLMGISYFLYRKNGGDDPFTMILYYLQLVVNALWSIVFFVLKWRFAAIIWILFLVLCVGLLLLRFFKEEKRTAYLNIPYFLWLLFATYLTVGIFLLNR